MTCTLAKLRSARGRLGQPFCDRRARGSRVVEGFETGSCAPIDGGQGNVACPTNSFWMPRCTFCKWPTFRRESSSPVQRRCDLRPFCRFHTRNLCDRRTSHHFRMWKPCTERIPRSFRAWKLEILRPVQRFRTRKLRQERISHCFHVFLELSEHALWSSPVLKRSLRQKKMCPHATNSHGASRESSDEVPHACGGPTTLFLAWVRSACSTPMASAPRPFLRQRQRLPFRPQPDFRECGQSRAFAFDATFPSAMVNPVAARVELLDDALRTKSEGKMTTACLRPFPVPNAASAFLRPSLGA